MEGRFRSLNTYFTVGPVVNTEVKNLWFGRFYFFVVNFELIGSELKFNIQFAHLPNVFFLLIETADFHLKFLLIIERLFKFLNGFIAGIQFLLFIRINFFNGGVFIR